MNSNIDILKQRLKNVDLSFENQMKIINDPEINSLFSSVFDSNGSVLYTELVSTFVYDNVIELAQLYLSENDIKVVSRNIDGSFIGDSYAFAFSKDEEIDIFTRYSNCTDSNVKSKLRDEIVNHNIGLVISLVKKYVNSDSIDFDDIIQDGNVGLLVAVDKYDVKTGYKFSTYATYWIMRFIRSSLQRKGRIIRLPNSAYDELRKLYKYKIDYYAGTGRDLDFMNAEDVKFASSAINASYDRMISALNSQNLISLDVPVSYDDDTASIGDFVVDDDIDIECDVLSSIEKQEIRDILNSDFLDNRASMILKKRYGFEGDPLTLKQTAKEMGISYERVRQIEIKSLNKLRHSYELNRRIR